MILIVKEIDVLDRMIFSWYSEMILVIKNLKNIHLICGGVLAVLKFSMLINTSNLEFVPRVILTNFSTTKRKFFHISRK